MDKDENGKLVWSEAEDKTLLEIKGHMIEFSYEHEGKVKDVYEGHVALGLLMAAEVVWPHSLSHRKDMPEGCFDAVLLAVNCNDIFAWGCADEEAISYGEIRELYELWKKDNNWGPAVWCMIRRREMCQGPAVSYIERAGAFKVEEIQQKHNLRPCYYDLMNKNLADAKYTTYAAWCAERGAAPIERSSREWWAGWDEYAKSHPDWHKSKWYEDVFVATRAHWQTL